MNNIYYVYILTNRSHTLYTGVTNNLQRRIWEHENKFDDGFTKKYHIDKLIYLEEYSDIRDALYREKQIKGRSRKKKIDLIKKINPTFKELFI